jgi:GNAT superfamily N-acetyltransferase
MMQKLDGVRTPTADDIPLLAELMIDAYRNTIDYDGETIEEALIEVRSYFDGRDGAPILGCSFLHFDQRQLTSACLLGWWQEKRSPLVSYIMTGAGWKNQGLASALLQEALRASADCGDTGVLAVVTEGNIPSESLLRHAGFVDWEE